MPRFKAEHINDLEPGCKVEINGRVYIRMADHPHYHVEEWVFDPATGQACHWSRLVRRNEMVNTVDAQWSCPACRQVGAWHCAHPDECGGMKLRKVTEPCAVRDGRCVSAGHLCQEHGQCNPYIARAQSTPQTPALL